MGNGKKERPANSVAAELAQLKRKHDAALLVITALVRRTGREVILRHEMEGLNRQPVTLSTRQTEDGGIVLETKDAQPPAARRPPQEQPAVPAGG